ncbi:hypothetical protein SK128_000612, partial [Halocaridina rubra]
MRISSMTANMSNALNDLTDLYGSLNLNGEPEDSNLQAIMRINSYLNNSLDLRNINSDQSTNKNIDSMLTELISGSHGTDVAANTSRKNAAPNVSCSVEPSIPLSRLLAQSYSYSSDSSTSPHTPVTPRTALPVCGRNSVFSYMDETPQSSVSNVSQYNISYTPNISQSMRASTTSDPGSPTLEDAILMGCQDSSSNAYNTDINSATKMNDMTLADFM